MIPEEMTPEKYEKVVSEILEEVIIYFKDEGYEYKIESGRANRVKGVSGIAHQIDVSAFLPNKENPTSIILIECKRWESSVTLEKVLAFYARVCDISEYYGDKIQIDPKIVTTSGFQKGAKLFAQYVNIETQRVRSANDFAMKYRGHGLAKSTQSAYLAGKAP